MGQNRISRKNLRSKLIQGACLGLVGVTIKAITLLNHWRTTYTIGLCVAGVMIIGVLVFAYLIPPEPDSDTGAHNS